MVVMAWILFLVFGLFWIGALSVSNKTPRQWIHFYFISFVVAVAAGIIWGGLFR